MRGVECLVGLVVGLLIGIAVSVRDKKTIAEQWVKENHRKFVEACFEGKLPQQELIKLLDYKEEIWRWEEEDGDEFYRGKEV